MVRVCEGHLRGDAKKPRCRFQAAGLCGGEREVLQVIFAFIYRIYIPVLYTGYFYKILYTNLLGFGC
jgi:hypothetical protein